MLFVDEASNKNWTNETATTTTNLCLFLIYFDFVNTLAGSVWLTHIVFGLNYTLTNTHSQRKTCLNDFFWVGWIIFFLELFRLQCIHAHSRTQIISILQNVCFVEMNSLIVNKCAVDRIVSHHHHHWKFCFTLYKWISSFIWLEAVNVLATVWWIIAIANNNNNKIKKENENKNKSEHIHFQNEAIDY